MMTKLLNNCHINLQPYYFYCLDREIILFQNFLSTTWLSLMTNVHFTFHVILKTTRPGYHHLPIEFLAFPKNEKLCIISTPNVYLKKPETVRKSKQLLVSFKEPHDLVKPAAVGWWCMETMKDAGIDITVFTSHSTGSSSTNKARIKVYHSSWLAIQQVGPQTPHLLNFITNQFIKILEHLLSILNKLNNS